MTTTPRAQKTVIVTGGAGYIGAHACKALHAAGYLPVVVDDLAAGCRDHVKWGPLVEADIAHTDAMSRIFEEYAPLAVMHFAAHIEVGESMQNPEKFYWNNVAGGLALLSTMRQHDIKNFIFSSTCAVYGQPNQVPITEATPRQPLNTYGKTKFMLELMLEDYSRAYGLNYIGFRYFNACGADPEGEIGERHDPETHLIPRALMAAAGRLPQLEIFGDDYPTPDGTCIRDYIHVSDLARAHALGVDYLLQGGSSRFLNLGTGHGQSVKAILDAVAKVTGKTVPVLIKPRRDGDPPQLIADPTTAQTVLNFKAEFQSLDRIIETAWNFHQRQWQQAG